MVPQGASTDSLQLEALLIGRTYLYTLFHKAFGGEPTEDLLNILTSEVTQDVLDEYAQNSETLAGLKPFLLQLGQQDTAEMIDAAKDEFTRTFIGPMTLPASPYESPYRTMEATLFQENTLVVREAFRSAGYLPKAYQHVPDDHVSIICHFAALRAQKVLNAFRSGEAEQAALLMREQNAFAREHMANWLGEYARQLRFSKTAVLYPQLMEALAAFVDTDVVFADEAAYWLEGDEAITGASGEFAEIDAALAALQAMRLPYLSENCLAPLS